MSQEKIAKTLDFLQPKLDIVTCSKRVGNKIFELSEYGKDGGEELLLATSVSVAITEFVVEELNNIWAQLRILEQRIESVKSEKK